MEYAKLTKSQKIAAFLIVIGPEAAAEVMRQFDNAQLEMNLPGDGGADRRRRRGPPEHSRRVLRSREHRPNLRAGRRGVRQIALEKAKGDYTASMILNRVAPASRSVEGGEDIRQMDARQILNLVKSEQPQTIAFILSYLDIPKAAEIILLLAPEMREEVMERLGGMEETSRDIVNKIAKISAATLTRKIPSKASTRAAA